MMRETLPVPAVNDVTLLAPTVAVVAVSPAPMSRAYVDGYERITIPEPPAPPEATAV
jgi:hypothetical protein